METPSGKSIDGTVHERASNACRRGARLRKALWVGSCVTIAALVAVAIGGVSPLWVVPFVIGTAAFALVAANESFDSVYGEVNDLEAARQSAMAEATSKAQFLANMSHEIRTPMNGILGMAELLVQTQLDADQDQMASTIQASADALLSVLNDILDFSKIEAGKLDLEIADFDAWQLIDECAGLMHRTADEKGVELMTFVDPRVGRCHQGDSSRIRQLLMNFLSNAVKFTLEGEVVMGVDLVDVPEDEGHETMRFWVRDTGVGISQDAIARLFMPFTQADASTTRRFGGTGLGLVICRRLVELMNGKLDVKSRTGRGSTFSFTLRLPMGQPIGERQRAEEVDLTGHSVLIVDDNDTNRKLMVMQLAPTMIGMDVAGNAISGLEMLRHAARIGKPFTMAILDMAMPGIDGMQLATAIHSDPDVPDIPVSLASSLGTRPSLVELADAGVFRWLSKPLASSRLLDVVKDMASLRSPKKEVRPKVEETAILNVEDLGLDMPVLVAEDNEINRRVIIGMLKRIGCRVTLAVDGREALQFVKQHDYALILMDCQMPEMDGFEATRAIRALGGNYSDLPILALTANVLPADREACMVAGMNDFLPKPIKLDLLRSAVKRWGHKAQAVT
ncbi:MAG: two-component system sensor histidine kinase/response regulator [Planctomycetota bacterium]|jgi:two-component system sensor histidine kinase/response regulator